MTTKKAKPRRRSPGWIESKAMGSAIKAELVPLMRAAGWSVVKGDLYRNDTYWWGRFSFERASPGLIEMLDIGYKYGWRARVRTHYVRLEGDDDQQHEQTQAWLDGYWCWSNFGAWVWLVYRLLNRAEDVLRFAMDDARHQLAEFEGFASAGRRPDRQDFSVDFRSKSRPWSEDERELFDAATVAEGN